MSLINCPECGKQVSSSAIKCPNCGYPITNINEKEATNIENFIDKEKPQKKLNIFALTLWGIFIFFAVFYGLQWIEKTSSDASDKNNIETSNQINRTVNDASEETYSNEIGDFSYELIDGKLILESYQGDSDSLRISPEYSLNGKTYPVDLSNFQVSQHSVNTIIFEEGITSFNHAVFNSSDIVKIYFPKSLLLVYDDTLAYLNSEHIDIYFGGNEDEWNEIFTEYDPDTFSEALENNDYEGAGSAIANVINSWVGHEYDPSKFTYHFNSDESFS